MPMFSKISLLLALLAAPLFGVEKFEVNLSASAKTLPIRVTSGSPALQALAVRAFNTHGRYRLVGAGTGALYNIAFSGAGGNAVRVDVTRGTDNQSVASETVTESTLNRSLFKAADFAVEKTNGQGLRGYFSSLITFAGGSGHNKSIYTSDLFLTAGAVRRVVSDGHDLLFPRWSPDGTRIIYTSYLHGFPDIYVANLATMQRSTFASFKGTNMSARYSPDGSHVAMILTGTGNPEIWVSDAQGHGLLRRTRSEVAKSSPCWSPDGRSIIFAQDPGPQLYTMSAFGGSSTRIAGGLGTYEAEPDWIHTDRGDRIAFTVRERSSGAYQIGRYDFTSAPKVVSNAPFDGVEPSWLPDGRHVVYTARDQSTSALCILDTETGKSTPLSLGRISGPVFQANVLRR
jgi:TolB protein